MRDNFATAERLKEELGMNMNEALMLLIVDYLEEIAENLGRLRK